MRQSCAPRIEAHAISQLFTARGRQIEALRDVSLQVASGEFIAIVGPSGCGKSSLLDILAGLRRPVAGCVLIDGQDVTGRLGRAALMPQRDLLLPWKSVLDNTALPLELAGCSRRTARGEAAGWFQRFGLAGFEQALPATLSGGMRQRAALLRTFLTGRDILLLDEPFGALDALTRASMQSWLHGVWMEFGKTVVLVTHDVDEAIFLADRVYLMSARPGSITATIPIPLARPRHYEQTVTSAPFTALKRELLHRLGAGTEGEP